MIYSLREINRKKKCFSICLTVNIVSFHLIKENDYLHISIVDANNTIDVDMIFRIVLGAVELLMRFEFI